jgi:hypothetical protein
MSYWIIYSLATLGILSTAVIFGTDMFFLTVGRAALQRASEGAGSEVMAFFHLYADTRMPIWGALAILSNILLALMSGGGHRWLYFTSVLMLLLFIVFYIRFAKPINRVQIEAAQNGQSLINGRKLQAAWNRLLLVRVPLQTASLLAQCIVFFVT